MSCTVFVQGNGIFDKCCCDAFGFYLFSVDRLGNVLTDLGPFAAADKRGFADGNMSLDKTRVGQTVSINKDKVVAACLFNGVVKRAGFSPPRIFLRQVYKIGYVPFF